VATSITSLVLGIVGGLVGLSVIALGGMIVFGTGKPPIPLASIGQPFESVDFSDLPPIETIRSRTGRQIIFRQWGDAGDGAERQPLVVAVHGSSATSASFQPLAKALRAEGIRVIAPDIRGHGATGERGDIDYPGQLDDDFADLLDAIRKRHPDAKLVLLGFSSGGGFALHVAASPLGKMFDRSVLLSPMLGVEAPTVRPEAKTWATAFIPRIIAISLLNQIGVHWFDHLTVLAFAIDPKRSDILTGYYSFLLMNAFGTGDYLADFRNANSRVIVLVGQRDQLFDAGKFSTAIAAVRTDIPVIIVPELDHIEMITDGRAIPAITEAIRGTANFTQSPTR
jgi:pimeloyl-ACP methyl ester carboxylesterase